jgi:hypothetical protein
MKLNRKAAMGFGAIAIVGLTAAGCSSETSTSSSSSPSVSASPSPVAVVKDLTGVNTQVALDAGFVSALESLKLTPGTVGTATLKDGVLAFPITGGDVTYYEPGSVDPYVQGMIKHNGSGISLSSGDTTVEMTNFDLDPATSKLYAKITANGDVAAERAYLFTLDGSTLMPLETGPNDTAILEGTRVLISPDAAALLNETFKTDAVTDELLVGIAKITINTK